jgi:hypothetical protein
MCIQEEAGRDTNRDYWIMFFKVFFIWKFIKIIFLYIFFKIYF